MHTPTDIYTLHSPYFPRTELSVDILFVDKVMEF